MSTIKVQTTQNVTVEYAVASVGDRILAYLIDVAVYLGWLIPCSVVLDDINSPVLNVLAFLPILFYQPACEIFLNGQSLGKKARDIKVIKLNGSVPTLGDYLLRWIFRIIDNMIFMGLVAIVVVAASTNGQRLGDMAAGTTVIRTTPVQRRKFFEVRMEENYEPRFPAVEQLTDHDMALVRKLLYKSLVHRNPVLLQSTAQRVKEVLAISSDLSDEEFLRTIVKDYHHLMSDSALFSS